VLAAAGFLLTGLAWALASPAGSSPDESFHGTSIWCPDPSTTSACYVGPSESFRPAVTAPAVFPGARCYAMQPENSGQCTYAYLQQGDGVTAEINVRDYPPFFYRFLHLFTSPDTNRAVLVMRVINLLIAGGLFALLGWWLPRRSSRRLAVYAVLGTSLPLLPFIVPSLNPSSWAIVGCAVFWLALHGLYTSPPQEPGWRRWALGGLATVGGLLALAARTDCGLYLIALGAVFAWIYRRRWWRRWALLVPTVVCAAGGVMTLLHSSQTETVGGWMDLLVRDATTTWNNVIDIPLVFAGFFGSDWMGSLGWWDAPMPTGVWFASLAVVAGLVALGLRRFTWSRTLALAALFALMCLLIMVPMQKLGYPRNANIQPRYIYPLYMASVGVALLGRRDRGTAPLNRLQTVIVYVMLVAAHCVALHQALRRWITGTDVNGFDLNTGIEWWRAQGPSPMAVWALGSCGFALVALLFFAVLGRPGAPAAARRKAPLAAGVLAGPAAPSGIGRRAEGLEDGQLFGQPLEPLLHGGQLHRQVDGHAQ
jgi:hypothetical protein